MLYKVSFAVQSISSEGHCHVTTWPDMNCQGSPAPLPLVHRKWSLLQPSIWICITRVLNNLTTNCFENDAAVRFVLLAGGVAGGVYVRGIDLKLERSSNRTLSLTGCYAEIMQRRHAVLIPSEEGSTPSDRGNTVSLEP